MADRGDSGDGDRGEGGSDADASMSDGGSSGDSNDTSMGGASSEMQGDDLPTDLGITRYKTDGSICYTKTLSLGDGAYLDAEGNAIVAP